MNYKTWNYLKQIRVICGSKISETNLFAYGQKQPIDIERTFTAILHRKEVIRKFGVLRCFSWGLTAKNGKLNIHIVGNAILVALPLRRLPFGLTNNYLSIQRQWEKVYECVST